MIANFFFFATLTKWEKIVTVTNFFYYYEICLIKPKMLVYVNQIYLVVAYVAKVSGYFTRFVYVY